MLNVYLQVALGLVSIGVLFFLFAVFSRKARIRNVVGAFFTTLVIGTLLIIGAPQFLNEREVKEEAYDSLGLVYAVAKEEAPQIAKALLENLRKDYRSDYTLAAARVALLQNDLQAAKALYRKVLASEPDLESEFDSILALGDAAFAYYGMDQNSDRALLSTNYSDATQAALNEITRQIKQAIPETGGNVYGKAAKHIVYADEAHQAYLAGKESEQAEVKKELRQLENLLGENPGLQQIPHVRLARLKLQVLSEDYKGIAASIDEHSDYHELLVASELYLTKQIKQADFRSSFSSQDVRKYQTVYNRMEKLYQTFFEHAPREEQQEAKAYVEALGASIRNPALGKMENQLLAYANSDNASDASKAYLQVAKIEHAMGNDGKVSAFLDRAMDTTGNCEDANYTVPMYELMGTITDKDNPERLQNSTQSVDRILNNNLTVKLSDKQIQVTDTDDGLAGDFAGEVQTYISKKRMSVKIVNVDVSDFEQTQTVKGTINISNHLYASPEELKNAMSVYDCGIEITDFELTKVDYSGANILLCVDTSGSMAERGKIEYLKDALKIFTDGMASIEKISLVAFNNEVKQDLPFGTSTSALIAASDSLHADGNTNIYGALRYSIEQFSRNPDEINSVIVMSDGLDNTPASLAEIEEQIGKVCQEKGITVYAVGFGQDADSSYLHTIAASTGGAYLFANAPNENTQTNQLSEFFEGLRSQILNQYTISFKAKDTLTYTRELRVQVGEGLDGDRVTYYLGGGEEAMSEGDLKNESPVYIHDKMVKGFEPRLLFKNGQSQTVLLRGQGFDPADNIRVTLRGTATGMEWRLESKYQDENQISLTIPANVGADIYDVLVSVNGKQAILPKGFALFLQGSEKVTDFGRYRFTSYMRQEDEADRTVRLSGYVTLNGWLSFNGEVVLQGDLSGQSISMSDSAGSMVNYSEADAEGLAYLLSLSCDSVSLPPLGRITLHNDLLSDDGRGDPQVEIFPLTQVNAGSLIHFKETEGRLYPNRAEFNTRSIATNFPFAKKIIRHKVDLFTFDAETGITVSAQKIGCKVDLEFSAGKSDKKTYYPVNFGNAPIYLAPNEFELHLDTLTNQYEIKFMTKVMFLPDVGLSAKWSSPDNGLVPTEFKLYLDKDVHSTIAGVPVVWSDFMVGITDIDITQNLFFWTLTGGFDLSAAKLSGVDKLAGLEDWLGDLSIAKINDATIALNLGKGYFGARGEIQLFEEITIASLEFDLGKFSYTNKLLNLNDEAVSGFRAKATLGSTWEFGSSSLTLKGSTEVSGTDRFMGIGIEGEFAASLKLWVIRISSGTYRGELVLGIRIGKNGTHAFVIRSKPWDVNITWPANVAGKF